MVMPASRRLDFSEIPIIDIGALVDGDEKGTAKVAEQLAHACSAVGFMYVKNHGVPRKLLDRLVEQTALFFKRPFEKKMEVTLEDSLQFRGYLPLGYESYKGDAERTGGKNLQEGFIIMHERPVHPERLSDGPNRWPADMPEFKPAMLDYFAATEKLAHQLLPGFALALGLDREFFKSMFSDGSSMLKLNHYPPQDSPEHIGEIGVTAHSDSGGYTILWQDDVGGLEVMNKSGEWVAAPPIEDTYVVNLGDLMQIWTNGRFSSTPHRVINRSGTDRYSIPSFTNPAYDSIVKPLIGEAPAGFKPYKSGPYQYDIYCRIFPQRAPRRVAAFVAA
jgi:isopenicillin N synthase-like dioxygenase